MKIYTDELKERLTKQFNANPHSNYHALDVFIISNDFKSVRDRIEGWIDEFPELTTNKSFINPFTEDGMYRQAITELVAGIAFKRLGFCLEFGKNFEGVTPDWYVGGESDEQRFIVEATTINRSVEDHKTANKIDDFFNSIRKLRVGVAIKISALSDESFRNFQSRNKKHYVELIASWLKTKPTIGSKYEVADFEFEIEGWKENSSAMSTKTPGSSFTADPTLFSQSIEKKFKKYKAIVESNDLGFWVAIETERGTKGLTLEMLIEILSGQRRAFSEKERWLPLTQKRKLLSPSNKGLFERNPSLSGIIWIESDFNMNRWVLKPLYNPFARHKLPTNLPDEIRFLRKRIFTKKNEQSNMRFFIVFWQAKIKVLIKRKLNTGETYFEEAIVHGESSVGYKTDSFPIKDQVLENIKLNHPNAEDISIINILELTREDFESWMSKGRNYLEGYHESKIRVFYD